MKITVNTRLLLKNKLEGIGRFSHEVLRRLVRNNPQHQFVFLFDRPFSDEFIYAENVTGVKLSPPARHPFLFYIWFEISVARWLKKNPSDLFFSPDGYLSLNSSTPQVPVIHDLNFEHYPKDLPAIYAWHYRKFFPKYARKAKQVLTVSNFSKKEIHDLYQIPESRINVVCNGISEDFKFENLGQDSKSFIESCTKSKPYFLAVGSIHPRKNLVRLFHAFSEFKKQSNSNHILLVVGDKYNWTSDLENAYSSNEFKEQIVFTGRLDNKNLAQAYAMAEALTYVSYYEGFGIPVLEAMAMNCPVIASNCTALPEVIDDAALLCDPFDVESITNAMQVITNSSETRETLIRKGKLQVQKYSWDLAAEQLQKHLGL